MIIIIVPRGIVVMPASYLCYNSYNNYRAMEFGKSAYENVKINNKHNAVCGLHCDEEMGVSPEKPCLYGAASPASRAFLF